MQDSKYNVRRSYRAAVDWISKKMIKEEYKRAKEKWMQLERLQAILIRINIWKMRYGSYQLYNNHFWWVIWARLGLELSTIKWLLQSRNSKIPKSSGQQKIPRLDVNDLRWYNNSGEPNVVKHDRIKKRLKKKIVILIHELKKIAES